MRWPEQLPLARPDLLRGDRPPLPRTPADRRCPALPEWPALVLAGVLALAACSPFAGFGPTEAVSETAAPAVGPDEASPVEEIPGAGSFAGLQESEVVDMLGDPAFVWNEGDARMWRYDTLSCSLLVFLYPDGVRHAEVLGGAEETCLCELQGGCT